MDRKAKILGDRRERIAIGRMQPFGPAIERESGRLYRVNAPADPVACLEHKHRDPAHVAQAPRRADPGSAGADHRDIDFGWQTRHRRPRRSSKLGLA